MFTGIAAFIVVAGTFAFPLPAFMKEVHLDKQMKGLQEQQSELEMMQDRTERLERELPLVMRGLQRQINRSLPCVENLLTLRDLALAQAGATEVKIESCTFTNPASLGFTVPDDDRMCTLASMQMELRGSSALESIHFFVGLLEATELVYSVNNLNITPSSTQIGEIDFRLELTVHFRTAKEGILQETRNRMH
jgi:hypothetical protein